MFHFQEGSSRTDSDEDMININGELSLNAGVLVRPTSDSFAATNEAGDSMREGDLGLGAVGSARV